MEEFDRVITNKVSFTSDLNRKSCPEVEIQFGYSGHPESASRRTFRMGSLIAPPLATERVPSLGDWNSKVGSGIGALA